MSSQPCCKRITRANVPLSVTSAWQGLWCHALRGDDGWKDSLRGSRAHPDYEAAEIRFGMKPHAQYQSRTETLLLVCRQTAGLTGQGAIVFGILVCSMLGDGSFSASRLLKDRNASQGRERHTVLLTFRGRPATVCLSDDFSLILLVISGPCPNTRSLSSQQDAAA